jgi:hypothetical protein
MHTYFTDFDKLGPSPQPRLSRPIGFVLPQHHPFPFDQNGNNGSNGFVFNPSSGVFPPLPTPQNSSSNTTGYLRSQSFPYGNPPFPSNIPYSNSSNSYRYSTSITGVFDTNTNAAFEKPGSSRVSPASAPVFEKLKTSDERKPNSSQISCNSKSTSEKPKSSLYSNLSSQVKMMSDDLIDLGQDDGRNVLESFDPLFERSKEEIKSSPKIQPQQRISMPVQKGASQKVPTFDQDIEPKKEDPESGGGGGSREDSTPPPPPGQTANASSDGSIASGISESDFGWKSEMSLYPPLPPISNSLYGTLEKATDQTDQSSLYDSYNQFEYLYAVSVSSDSSFYWHPYDSVPPSQGGPIYSPSSPSGTSSTTNFPPGQIREKFSSKSSDRKRSSYQVILITFGVSRDLQLNSHVRMAYYNLQYSYF